MRRRLLPLIAGALILVAGALLSGCGSTTYNQSSVTASYDAAASTSSTYAINLQATLPSGHCLDWISYTWSKPVRENTVWSRPAAVACVPGPVQQVVRVPTRAGGGTLHLRVHTREHLPFGSGGDQDHSWSQAIVIPGSAPAVSGGSSTPLAAVVFAQHSPAKDATTLLDARQSTGTAPLTYNWSAGCSDTSGLAAGLARIAIIANVFPSSCTVRVTDATGAIASATATLTENSDITRNGAITFPSGTQAQLTSAMETGFAVPLESDLACVDLDGGTSFRTFVTIGTGVAGSLTGRVTLTALTPGVHRISAALFTDPFNTHGPWNDAKCASITNPTTNSDFIQTVSALYNVAADGSVAAARRGGRATPAFVAPSSLRFVSNKTITEGTADKFGALTGATASGTFSWATPKTSKGIKRPAGAGDVAKGTYVMRSISMSPGPKTGASSLLLGTGTVLLRGVSGTLACGTIAGTFDSSTLTLTGGTGTARTLAGVVTGKPIGYVFPKPAKRPTKQPTKKPAKTKPARVKPVKAVGTATLQTAAKATALPAACKALVQYLPN